MDTLLESAKDNVKKMVTAWNGDVTMLDGLLDEIKLELLRGIGIEQTPEPPTDEGQARVDDFLRGMGLEK